MNFISVPGMLVCSSFLISGCMFVYCVERFANIECYSDCSRRGVHLVEHIFYCVIYYMLVRNANQRGPMCFTFR